MGIFQWKICFMFEISVRNRSISVRGKTNQDLLSSSSDFLREGKVKEAQREINLGKVGQNEEKFITACSLVCPCCPCIMKYSEWLWTCAVSDGE